MIWIAPGSESDAKWSSTNIINYRLDRDYVVQFAQRVNSILASNRAVAGTQRIESAK